MNYKTQLNRKEIHFPLLTIPPLSIARALTCSAVVFHRHFHTVGLGTKGLSGTAARNQPEIAVVRSKCRSS